MNKRASQKALEALEANEAQARRKTWGDAAKARWEARKADSAPAALIWAPKEDPQERAQRDRDIAAGLLPF